MVAEARVTHVAEIPKRLTVIECLVPGLTGVVDFTYDVRLVVLSAEPVFDEEEGGTGRSGSAWPPHNAAAVYGESKVGTEERPEYVSYCFLSWNDPDLSN
ncbi:hypothetical protein EJB05_22790 [Eragrostis curvula]|uniref:Uncharacterized protein n=1 Tax=Eragrostis curvula TaxID=38414 RepID=A0A5J9V4T3_9POAL|nr:hypothetical protein EJB05_22790 [Eragrostis curvula]